MTEEARRTIRLDQFVKITGIAGTGGQAKVLVQSGKVMVNDETETRRGRKLVLGDRVAVEGKSMTVAEELLRRPSSGEGDEGEGGPPSGKSAKSTPYGATMRDHPASSGGAESSGRPVSSGSAGLPKRDRGKPSDAGKARVPANDARPAGKKKVREKRGRRPLGGGKRSPGKPKTQAPVDAAQFESTSEPKRKPFRAR